MLLSIALVAAQALTSVFAQGTKISPPPGRGSSAAFFIYQDVDRIARPGGALDVCTDVKAIRSQCYTLGVKEKSYAAEQACLCDPTAAYAVTQCFATQYGKSTNSTNKSQLYQNFLYYTYDCYCGVTGYDVSYDTSVNPVKPYVAGYTGDSILPPTGGCPADSKSPPSDKVCPSKPPCNTCQVPQPPQPQPCPSGYDRCGDNCVPVCTPYLPCNFPKVYDNTGKCVCPRGLTPVGADSCEVPRCDDPNQEYILGPRGGYCTCINGYEWNGTSCQEICPDGQYRRALGAPCETECEPPLLKGYSGECVCPYSLGYEEKDGRCEKVVCTTPETLSPYGAYCICVDPFYYDATGKCSTPGCYDYTNPECFPGLAPVDNSTIVIVSSAPAFMSSFSDIATLALPSTMISNSSALPPDESVLTSSSASDQQPPEPTPTADATSPAEIPTAGDTVQPPDSSPTEPPVQPPSPTPEDPATSPIAEAPEQPEASLESAPDTPEPSPSARRVRWARALLF